MSKKKKPQHRAPVPRESIAKPTDHLDPALAKWGVITVRGITLTLEEDQVKDWEVVEGITILQNAASTNGDKLIAGVQVLRTLLRGDYDRVKAELRQQNGGNLPAEVMTSFIREVFDNLRPES